MNTPLHHRRSLGLAACVAAIVLASSPFTQAATQTVGTVAVMNTVNRSIIEATGNSGNSFTATTFASNMTTAFTANTGGVWNFDTAFSQVNVGDTVTVNLGTSQTNSLVMTLASGNPINQATNIAGEATSGTTGMGLASDGATRVFNLSGANVLSIGFFSLDRNNTDRFASMTVTFLDNTTLTTSAPDADNTYFLGLSATGTNYIKSFSISQANFIRYDDLSFIVAPAAVPEPSTYGIAAGGLALVGAMVVRRRRAKV